MKISNLYQFESQYNIKDMIYVNTVLIYCLRASGILQN